MSNFTCTAEESAYRDAVSLDLLLEAEYSWEDAERIVRRFREAREKDERESKE